MDFVNRAYSQLADLYRSMTPGARLTSGLLAVAVLFGTGYSFTHQTASPEVDLMHGEPIAAGQLPIMEAAFAKTNLKGYEVRGAAIYVPRGQEAAYMAALATAKALPPNFGDALREAVSSDSFFKTVEGAPQREQRIKIATQDTLSLIIATMPGIERAYVMYDEDNRPAFGKEKLVTATVSVKPRGSSQLDEACVSAIRGLVAGSIAHLKPENVTVCDLTGRTWYGNSDRGGSGEENLYISLKRTHEQDLKAKILQVLFYIPNVTVGTNVELAREQFSRATPSKRAANPARDRPANGRRSQSLDKDGRTDSAAASFQQPNTAAVLKALLGGSDGSNAGSESNETDSVAEERTEKEIAGLTPTRATASVSVPSSYFRSVWQQRNPAEPGKPLRGPDQAALDQIRIEESAKIQKHVAQLLPSANSVGRAAELVTVTTFQDIPIQEPPLPDFRQDVLGWLRQSWRTLGAIGLALVSLLMLRSMVRRTPMAAMPATSSSANRTEDNVTGDRPSQIPAPHARRFRTAGSSLQDELSELVDDDPDAAASVLRSWIGQVG